MYNLGSNAWYFLFPAFVTIVALKGYKKPRVGIFLLLLMLFFSMFRGDHVGNDTLNYMDEASIGYRGNLDIELSQNYIADNFGSGTEFLSLLLYRAVAVFNLPPRTMIWTFSIVTFAFFYLAVKRFKANLAFVSTIYVLSGLYFFSLTAARQMAAVSVFLFGCTYLLEENKRKSLLFFVFTVVAGMIHTSALFYIWLYIFRYIKSINKNFLTLCIIGVALITVVADFNVMDIVYKFFNIEYITRYQGLFDDSERGFLGRIFDILRFAFLIPIFAITPSNDNRKVQNQIYFLAICLMSVFCHANGLVARVTYYVTVFMGVYISQKLIDDNLIKNQNIKFLFFIYIICSIYGTGKWACSSLTSGYYLMF